MNDRSLDRSRLLVSRVGQRAMREKIHRVMVLWDLGYLRESLSQFRLVAEDALRRLVRQATAPDLRPALEQALEQGQAARVIERLYRELELVPARIALHLHTLLAWGNYASHHQTLGHHAQSGDLQVLISIAVDLEDWLAIEVERTTSIYDPEDMAWAMHQAETQTITAGLDPAVARAFINGCGASIQAEAHRMVAPTLGLELYWDRAPDVPVGNSPFRGLTAFDVQDAPRFHGRARLALQLEQTVDTRRLTVVSGASGAGKTSLLRAALVPTLLELLLQPLDSSVALCLQRSRSPPDRIDLCQQRPVVRQLLAQRMPHRDDRCAHPQREHREQDPRKPHHRGRGSAPRRELELQPLLLQRHLGLHPRPALGLCQSQLHLPRLALTPSLVLGPRRPLLLGGLRGLRRGALLPPQLLLPSGSPFHVDSIGLDGAQLVERHQQRVNAAVHGGASPVGFLALDAYAAPR